LHYTEITAHNIKERQRNREKLTA